MDFVSVIMPAYNSEKYISKAIESVLAQTHKNLELIVIDDCSTDNTVDVAKKIAELDSRVCVYQNDHNMGVAETRNRGFMLAKGQWIALLDSDDVWYEEKIEKQLELARTTNADIIYSSYTLIDGETGIEKKTYIVPEITDYKQMLKENVIGCSTVVLKKELVEKFKFNSDFSHEDYALWLNILKAGYKAAALTESLVGYTVIKNSRSFNKWKAAKNRWKILRKDQHLPLYKTIPAFFAYAIRGVIKHGG